MTYQNTEEDQSADIGESFSGTIIGELGECVKTAAETILAKGETEELAYDETVDNNLRYIGANPNNYVQFNTDWLYDSSNDQWTLTLYSGGSDHGFAVSCGGDVYYIYGTRAGKAVSPVLYLSSNVKITGGTGEESDPFILSL